jgi:hypothetical protein
MIGLDAIDKAGPDRIVKPSSGTFQADCRFAGAFDLGVKFSASGRPRCEPDNVLGAPMMQAVATRPVAASEARPGDTGAFAGGALGLCVQRG